MLLPGGLPSCPIAAVAQTHIRVSKAPAFAHLDHFSFPIPRCLQGMESLDRGDLGATLCSGVARFLQTDTNVKAGSFLISAGGVVTCSDPPVQKVGICFSHEEEPSHG